MLKITRSSKKSTPKVFMTSSDEIIGGNRANETITNLFKKSKTYIPKLRAMGKSKFLTSNIKEIFN